MFYSKIEIKFNRTFAALWSRAYRPSCELQFYSFFVKSAIERERVRHHTHKQREWAQREQKPSRRNRTIEARNPTGDGHEHMTRTRGSTLFHKTKQEKSTPSPATFYHARILSVTVCSASRSDCSITFATPSQGLCVRVCVCVCVFVCQWPTSITKCWMSPNSVVGANR